ncbi:MAG TPA: four helix bundle protein [Phycisphaerae bacterium]|jgi:four helix bundle protein|nr:four helix bundle protein [Phycisphaerae bacterium]HOB76193.1 four helix bundle protein [Phycisphaerae bacterium]HOJ53897.1 four helix bundle protein [Phycisphaerae bacterium]HOL27511.1 four helix bundle protein [Phycisphaerae bacterium]HPP21707.1 four helix bundle protein [Phycisphaerae bacterium]
MQNFKTLKVWQAAHRLALDVYHATRKYPREELYGLTRQSRESASSVPTNIAEGCGRGGKKDFSRFLRIAAGSASELEYQLLLGHDLAYLSPSDYLRLNAQAIEVKRMLAALITKVDPCDEPEAGQRLAKTDN